MINVKDNKCKHKNLKQNHHITDMIPKMPKMIHQDGSQMTMMTPQMTKMIHQDGPKMIPRGTGPSATQDRHSKRGCPPRMDKASELLNPSLLERGGVSAQN